MRPFRQRKTGSNGSLASAELYDPTSGTWSATGNMVAGRGYPVALVLSNGEVLVAGGASGAGGSMLASAELYDPAGGTWTATGGMITARFHVLMAVELPNGDVLVAGGNLGSPSNNAVASAELYDPGSGS